MIKLWKLNVKSKNLNNPFKSVLLLYKQLSISINVTIIASMLLFVLSCVKTGKHASKWDDIVTELNLSYASRKEFRLYMNDLEYCDGNIAVAIKNQNWEKIRKHARQLRKILPVVLTGMEKEELPEDFVTFDSKYHLSTLKLVEAAEAGEMDQLSIEYEKVKQACDNCHIRYKEGRMWKCYK